MTRLFAADDFPAIRARLAELRRERHDIKENVPADPDLRVTIESRHRTAAAAGSRSLGSSELLPMQQTLLKRLKAATA